MIGNKCDCADRRVVTTEAGEKLAKEFGIPYMETSAKENINVSEVWEVHQHTAIISKGYTYGCLKELDVNVTIQKVMAINAMLVV